MHANSERILMMVGAQWVLDAFSMDSLNENGGSLRLFWSPNEHWLQTDWPRGLLTGRDFFLGKQNRT